MNKNAFGTIRINQILSFLYFFKKWFSETPMSACEHVFCHCVMLFDGNFGEKVMIVTVGFGEVVLAFAEFDCCCYYYCSFVGFESG